MSLCDKCIHRNVCGNEDAREEAVKVCDDFIDKSILSVPEREKHYCKNCMFFNTVDIRNCVYVCGLKGGTVYGCDCCEEWKGSAVPKREKGTLEDIRSEILGYNVRGRVSGSESFLMGYARGMDKAAEIVGKYIGGKE